MDRTCPNCNETKDETEFRLMEKYTRGYRVKHCKKCENYLANHKREIEAEKQKKEQKKWAFLYKNPMKI